MKTMLACLIFFAFVTTAKAETAFIVSHATLTIYSSTVPEVIQLQIENYNLRKRNTCLQIKFDYLVEWSKTEIQNLQNTLNHKEAKPVASLDSLVDESICEPERTKRTKR